MFGSIALSAGSGGAAWGGRGALAAVSAAGTLLGAQGLAEAVRCRKDGGKSERQLQQARLGPGQLGDGVHQGRPSLMPTGAGGKKMNKEQARGRHMTDAAARPRAKNKASPSDESKGEIQVQKGPQGKAVATTTKESDGDASSELERPVPIGSMKFKKDFDVPNYGARANGNGITNGAGAAAEHEDID